jgi:hypothetical protein
VLGILGQPLRWICKDREPPGVSAHSPPQGPGPPGVFKGVLSN